MTDEFKHKMFTDPVCLLKESELIYLAESMDNASIYLSEICAQIHFAAMKDVHAWPDFAAIKGLQAEMRNIIEWQKQIKGKLQTETIDRSEGESLH